MHGNQYKIIIRSVLLLIAVISSKSQVKVIMSSNGKNATITQILPFSCWHPVLSIYYNSFTLYLTNLQQQQGRSQNEITSQVSISFEYLNQSFKLPINGTEIALKIDTSSYPYQQQITEKLNISIINYGYQGSLPNQLSTFRQLYMLKFQSTNDHYTINLPLESIILTQIVALLIICLFPFNIQYRRIKPMSFNVIFAVLYACLLFIGVYLNSIAQQFTKFNLQFWQQLLVQGFSFVCLFFYTQDLISIYLLPMKLLTDSIAFIFSLAIVLVDMIFLEDAWFINDIIAVGVAGALIKFVVIKKLKSSLIPIMILWVFFVCRQFAIDFHLQSFSQSLQLELIPLFLQIPALNPLNGFLCSAFGTSKVICFGLLLHYSIRLDLFFSRRFYTTLGICLAFVFMGVQLLFNIMLDELPTMQFISVILFVPVYLVLILLMAGKRGEMAEVWHGSFYDVAINRIKIKRQSQQTSTIQQSFGESLRVNNTMISN